MDLNISIWSSKADDIIAWGVIGRSGISLLYLVCGQQGPEYSYFSIGSSKANNITAWGVIERSGISLLYL